MAVSPNHELFEADFIEVAGDFRTLFSKCLDLKLRYDATGLAAIVFGLATDGTPVPGLKHDKGTMTATITAVVQFINFMNGATVTEGTYKDVTALSDSLRDV